MYNSIRIIQAWRARTDTYSRQLLVSDVVANVVEDMNHSPVGAKCQELTRARKRIENIICDHARLEICHGNNRYPLLPH